MGTVVVGYVAKPEGEAALAKGIAEAQLRDAKLVLVSSHRGGSDFDDEAAQLAESEIDSVKEKLDAAGVAYDVRQLVRGFEPAADLISIAEANRAELIVIGLRRRSPVGKLILGSNAQRILLDARCPVMAVKAGTPALTDPLVPPGGSHPGPAGGPPWRSGSSASRPTSSPSSTARRWRSPACWRPSGSASAPRSWRPSRCCSCWSTPAMQIPVGLLVDRWGPRAVLLGGAALLTVSQVGFALATTYPVALLARVGVGMGDAMTFICVLRLVNTWFAPRRVPLVTQCTGVAARPARWWRPCR